MQRRRYEPVAGGAGLQRCVTFYRPPKRHATPSTRGFVRNQSAMASSGHSVSRITFRLPKGLPILSLCSTRFSNFVDSDSCSGQWGIRSPDTSTGPLWLIHAGDRPWRSGWRITTRQELMLCIIWGCRLHQRVQIPCGLRCRVAPGYLEPSTVRCAHLSL